MRAYAENRKIVGCNRLETKSLGLRTTGEIYIRTVSRNGHGLKYTGILEVSPLRNRDADALCSYAG